MNDKISLPILYGKSTKGKIKEWSIAALQTDDGNCYVKTEHGYEDCKKQIDQRHVKKGKNIGKANETTAFEQALFEAKSAHNRKKDSGYVEDKNNIPDESNKMFLPMLAHRYDAHATKINFPCWVQPKLDGVRMLARKKDGVVTMWSRRGKVINLLDKIKDQLCKILEDGQCSDGELYVHGWTFQRIVSATKKASEDTKELEYHIYDSPHPVLPFEERAICPFWKKQKNIKIVKSTIVNNCKEFDQSESAMIKLGYEGMMVRNKKSLYKYAHRSYDLQKVKRFSDDEYKIIGGKDGVGRESGLIVFRCVTSDGGEFDVRPCGTHEERANVFKNLKAYIGQNLTVKYQGLTDDGIPRFPVGIAIRNYE